MSQLSRMDNNGAGMQKKRLAAARRGNLCNVSQSTYRTMFASSNLGYFYLCESAAVAAPDKCPYTCIEP